MDALSLAAAARDAGDRPALLCDAGPLDFAGLAALADAVAGALDLDRAAPDELVAFEASPGAPAVALALALLERGVAFLPLHPRWTEAERARACARLGARRLEVPTLSPPRSPAPSAALAAPGPLHSPARLACVLATSGTSGEPKGVELTRESLVASARAHSANVPFRAGDRWLLGLPFAHAGGLAILVRCLIARAAVVLRPGFDPDDALASVRAHRVSLLSVVPTMLDRLLARDRGELAALRMVLVGGAHFPLELRRRAAQAGVPAIASYGLTETASQICAQPPAAPAALAESVDSGRALHGATVAIVGEDGQPCPPGEPGTIAVAGPMLFRGYRAASQGSAHGAAGAAPRASGAFRTGDLGWLDDRGRLVVLGRSDDMVITGGENVHPSEVEAALRAQPGVLDVAAFGVPDPRWGQRVAVALVLAPSASAERAIADAAVGLAGFKRPRALIVLPALPQNALGKVDRKALVALAARGQLRDVT